MASFVCIMHWEVVDMSTYKEYKVHLDTGTGVVSCPELGLEANSWPELKKRIDDYRKKYVKREKVILITHPNHVVVAMTGAKHSDRRVWVSYVGRNGENVRETRAIDDLIQHTEDSLKRVKELSDKVASAGKDYELSQSELRKFIASHPFKPGGGK